MTHASESSYAKPALLKQTSYDDIKGPGYQGKGFDARTGSFMPSDF